jgi:hypothetical protein
MTKMDTKCMKDFSRHQKDTDMMDEYLLVEEVEMGESYSELSADGDRE